MSKTVDLEKAAKKAKEKLISEENNEVVVEESTEVVDKENKPKRRTHKSAPVQKEEVIKEDLVPNIKVSSLLMADQDRMREEQINNVNIDLIRSLLTSIPDEIMEKEVNNLANKAHAYRKMRFEISDNVAEVDEATNEYIEGLAAKVVIQHGNIKKSETVALVKIDKSNKDDVEFTAEEKEKLQVAKAIQLVLIENEELEHLKVREVNQLSVSNKLSLIRQNMDGLAFHSMAMPATGDYMQFKGTSSVQLLQNAVATSDETAVEELEKKSSLIYDRIISSKLIDKYDDTGNLSLSYEDFINFFKYPDIDSALAAIYIASSPEEYSGNLTCNNCKKQFDHIFRAKHMNTIEEYPRVMKDNVMKITENRSNIKVLEDLNSENSKSLRIRSNHSKTIYSLSIPSIATARELFIALEGRDVNPVVRAILLYLDNIYLHSPENDDYIKISRDEITMLLEIITNLNDLDMFTINEIIDKRLRYDISFLHKTVCPHCKTEVTVNLNLYNLVFLQAQDILMEVTIQNQ